MDSGAAMFSSRRSKIFLATFAVLCIVGVAACVVVVAESSSSKNAADESMLERAMPSKQQEEKFDREQNMKYATNTSSVKLPQKGKVLRRVSNRFTRKLRSADITNSAIGGEDTAHCISSTSNTTIPAAHIHGHGYKNFTPSTVRSSFIYNGYQQKWRCNGYLDDLGLHAFVDGGMIFNQTDKSLRVPICGYYHVTSQILFKIPGQVPNPTSIYHNLKFQSKCPTSQKRDPELSVTGWNMVPKTHNGAKVTTHTSDVFHLCAGGKVWVEIPEGRKRNDVCCPFADEDSTFIAAYLISPTSCNWPPTINQSFE